MHTGKNSAQTDINLRNIHSISLASQSVINVEVGGMCLFLLQSRTCYNIHIIFNFAERYLLRNRLN